MYACYGSESESETALKKGQDSSWGTKEGIAVLEGEH
jgi:hypothetical protein